MHRWVVFFSVWAIAALASGNTKPLNENEEVRFGDPDQIHNPMPLNPEFSPDGIQKPEPIILPEIDEDSENPMPFHDVDESVHIPVDMPPFSDLDVDQPLNDANTDDESYYSNDELESEEDDYEPVQLNSFPSQDEIKNPMPLNPDPWDGEGDAPLWRENATVREARAIAPPTYHGGRVLINPINVYIVWYGSWGNLGGDQEMIEYLFENIQSSAWWQMATRYTQNKNGVITPVTPNVRLAGAVQAPLSHGKSLASPQVVYNIVNNVLDINLLPMDTDGVYFVLTAPNIAVTNFCVNFCGWHSGFNYRGNQILVSMVPHSASSTKGATCRTNVGGSGFGFGASVGGYNMVNVIAHELVESATDPIGNAWYRTSDHYENADMCSWKFGTVKKVSNYNYNVQLGSKYFLIQQFYDLKSGRCASA